MSEPAELEQLRHMTGHLAQQLQAVRRISTGLSAITNVDDMMRQALNICLELAEAEAGSILVYNPRTKKLVFDYVVGPKADELTGVELDPDLQVNGEQFLTAPGKVIEEVERHPDLRGAGEKMHHRSANMITAPLTSSDGQAIGRMQIINLVGEPFDEHDVTLVEIMAAQVGLAANAARLQEQARLATVVRFIGNISHDVKNMVTPAMTGAETLRLISSDCFQRFDESLERVTVAEDEVSEIAGSLGELRDLYPEMTDLIIESCHVVQQRVAELSAAIKGMVSKPNFRPTDITAVAQRVGTMLDIHAQKKGVTLNIEPVGDVPEAEADPKQLYNAIYNLILNAIDACEDGDSITFRMSGRAEGEFPAGNYVLMECEDTGPGMPEEIKAKLFTDQAISTKPMGTGLGTRIVKNVIDAHRGTVEVESEVGKGTTIRCRIPTSRHG